MTKRQTGIRLPDITQRQLTALCQSTGMNQSAVVVTALDRMYREKQMMRAKVEVDGQIMEGFVRVNAAGRTELCVDTVDNVAVADDGDYDGIVPIVPIDDDPHAD